jgi:MOSC domain-containing protein YiiM
MRCAYGLAVLPRAFLENMTTSSIGLYSLQIGDRIRIGEAELEVTQIGKECHQRCAIFYQAGDCVMPKEGIFARVLKGGVITVGEEVEVESGNSCGE